RGIVCVEHTLGRFLVRLIQEKARSKRKATFFVEVNMPSLTEKPDVIFEEDDLPYEEEIIRNPYSVKCWMRYIEYKQNGPKSVLNMIYERALKELPGSYKLWYNYLRERRKQVKGRCITEPAYEEINNCHERALVFMHKKGLDTGP
ncbi:hypothetical protein ANANG_G00294700, partial [Anguilla anguilla]